MKPSRCACCRTELDSAFPGDEAATPHRATVFISHGNYGSTLYDPMGGSPSYLQLNICDTCLAAAAEDGAVVKVHILRQPPPATYELWDPSKES